MRPAADPPSPLVHGQAFRLKTPRYALWRKLSTADTSTGGRVWPHVRFRPKPLRSDYSIELRIGVTRDAQKSFHFFPAATKAPTCATCANRQAMRRRCER